MKTFIPKVSGKDEQKWYLIDADGQILGRVATVIADLLRGKNKPIFTPHMDNGDFVIVINADKVAVTGTKEHDKMYYRHSGYPGNLKTFNLGDIRERKPELLIKHAVGGMLPKNKLRDQFLSKLRIFPGPEHGHQAQNPEKVTL